MKFFPVCFLTLVLFFPFVVKADSVFTAQSGAWESPATWQSGFVPGPGDNVKIGHAVTLSGNHSVYYLNQQPGSQLTLTNGAVLSISTASDVNQATLKLSSGSTLSLSSQLHFSNRALLNAECDSSVWCTVDGNNSLGGLQFSQGAQLLSRFVNFIELGTQTTPAITLYHPVTLSIIGSRFVRGGSLYSMNTPTSIDQFQVIDSSWQDSLSDVSLVTSGWTTPTSGSRVLRGNVFDKSVHLLPPSHFTIEENYFHVGYLASQGRWSSFKKNLVRHAGIGMLIQGDTKDNFWLIDEPQMQNPHFVFAGPPPSIDLDGEIFEFTGTDGNGDCLLASEVYDQAHVSLRNSIVLPNAGGENSGTLMSALGGPGINLYVEHNTYFTGSQGAAVGETYDGHGGILRSFRSNIAWDNQNSTRGFLLLSYSPLSDLGAASSLTHNTIFGLLHSYYQMVFSSGTPGLGDMSTDPQFVDPARDISSWDASLGGQGTVASALSGLRRKNEPGMAFTPYRIGNLIKYVRQGFFPLNQTLHGTAHDGATRGAVQNQEGDTLSGPAPIPVIPPTQPNGPGYTPQPNTNSPDPQVTIVDPSTGVVITVMPPIIIGPKDSEINAETTQPSLCSRKRRKRCRRKRKRVTRKCKCRKRRVRRR